MSLTATPSPATDLQRRLRRTVAWVRALLLAGAGVLVWHVARVWSAPERALAEVTTLTGVSCIDRVTTQAMVLGAAASVGVLAVMLFGLYRLWQLCDQYARGRVFSAEALAALRGFARCLLATAFLGPLHGALLSVVFTLVNGPGRRELSVNVSSSDYTLVLMGALLLAVASVMAEARRVSDENAGFV